MLTNHQVPGFSKTLTIANQFGELARVASWLEQMAQHYLLAERTVFKLDLVLNEALPNIISYAYPDQLSHNILMKLEDTGDYVILEIIDDGMAFNPFEAVPLPDQLDLESSSINGRGIHLIKTFTDAQDYQRINNTNIMRVTIRKSPEPRKHLKASIA
jgi:anti-sigma regulatory factor (Ser/Thr protein kinase)